MTEEQKQKLEQQLWNIANELRGKMGADEFRDYILGFIFYKYLSEKQHLYANNLLETEAVKDYTDVSDEEDIEAIKEESLSKLGYFLRPNELFAEISRRGNADVEEESNFILEDLQNILNGIEQSTMGTESEDDFNQLFEDLDLGSTKLGRSVEARNMLIAKVLSHLDKIDFGLEDADSDVLGDAYEYLIAQFASGAGKKAGEFYTPQQVSKIMAKIVTLDKKRIKSAYDPACGSGSLLLRIAREADVGEFFGQELNRTTYNLARMNMILHDVHFSKFDIKQEDTLLYPQHLEERFDVVVANPPFSAKWKGKDNPLNETDDRFSQYGALAPTSKADFAFVQHMIYQLNDSGAMAVVLPHGVLFRGATEGKIRKYIIQEQNFLDAVIGLPANLFYGTSIPACILIFKKCRIHDDNILFIDTSQDFVKNGNQNALTDEHVEKIVATYQKRENIDKYAHVASLEEIKENDYNLNIPRYVNTFDEEEPVDIAAVVGGLKALETDMYDTDKTIAYFCRELNVPIPVGFNLPLLGQYKKGMMQKIFRQELRFKDEQGNEFPDWAEKRLGDIAVFSKGKGISKADIFEDGAFECIRYGQLYTDYAETIRGIKSRTNIPANGLVLSEANDIIIPASGETQIDIATASCVLKDGVALGGDLNIVKTKNDGIFLSYYLNSKKKYDIARLSQGISVVHLYASQLKLLHLNLPSVPEQKKIADFLSALDQKINLITIELNHTQTFKKGLLQQMFI